jgi:type II secretory pathway predicted ATPase ExeA
MTTPTTSWVAHFGLSCLPFQKTLATTDLLQRLSHQEAVARLRFCISEALVGVLTGEVGVGKTIAVRAATDTLDPSAFHIVYLPNPLVGDRGLYVTIVRALGAQPRFFKAEVVAQAQMLLAQEDMERRRRVILAIDEAHLLSPHQLEELRLLTSAEMDSRSHFALLLIGQPMLARQLRMGSYTALDQRIATRYQLQPMDLEESVRYVRHRLRLAGRQEPLFADDALARLHRASLGLPRQLNNLCVSALIAAHGKAKSIVDDDCAMHAVAELNRDKE